LKTIITGKRKDGTTYGEPIDASLKYQKIEFVDTAEQIYYDYADQLLKRIKELVELENAINFDGNVELEILLTEDEVETFFTRVTKLDTVRTIYLGHDVSLTLEQQRIINNNNITVNVIPEYYYKEKQI
jgi:adenine-specific DNA-methyltransferase